MKALILAAGYATRLYPLTLNKPKPLLPIAGRPMLEHIIEKLDGINGINEFLIVTNHKFAGHFSEWGEEFSRKKPGFKVRVFDDGSTSDADKLGAIGDMQFAIKNAPIKEPLLIVSGDNLFDQPLKGFGDFCAGKDHAVTAVYDVKNLEEIKKYNNITMDKDGRITFFEEKPKEPKGTMTGVGLYYFPLNVVEAISTYISEGNNPDQPGRFMQWLYTRKPVYTWTVPGIWYDIGSKEMLEEADRIFSAPKL